MEEIIISPVSENYWINFTRLRITHEDLHKSYVSKVKHIKDKKLAATNFKILNNILPCNRNLRKWGKSDTDLCCFCQEEDNISHLLYFVYMLNQFGKLLTMSYYQVNLSHMIWLCLAIRVETSTRVLGLG